MESLSFQIQHHGTDAWRPQRIRVFYDDGSFVNCPNTSGSLVDDSESLILFCEWIISLSPLLIIEEIEIRNWVHCSDFFVTSFRTIKAQGAFALMFQMWLTMLLWWKISPWSKVLLWLKYQLRFHLSFDNVVKSVWIHLCHVLVLVYLCGARVKKLFQAVN